MIVAHLPDWLRGAAKPLAPLKRALGLWSAAGGLRMSAAMSFYGILSLAPLLLALVALLGWWVDKEMLQHGLVNQVTIVMGEQGGKLVEGALASARETGEGIWAAVVGFIVLLMGATGVFSELQDAFELVWTQGREQPVKLPWWHAATIRLRGIGYILVFGFLLLVSLALSALLAMFAGWAGANLLTETLLRALNEVVGLFIATGLFFGLMRLSSGPKPKARYLLLGAFIGAVLFTVGRQLLAMYLSKASVVSAYGAAGSLIVMLVWIYFSSAVLLFGAGCARAASELRQSRDLRWAPHNASADTMPATSSTTSPQR